ncbi:MAG: Ribosomal RNA small subunit methyltransferase I [candidate division WWE3 bacterium GW2011_GWA1_41_8]|uniref:Ribosomal RNA small subunit methyltransferase I n=1 Tax=candidate division WWE3 bacterium GW2011_GWA1_41_8 TaxID=1619103 RepID=A0A0G0X8V1_UNCKA|nr:MAG: Ribosomal RNA small subunit methyltransferase I [candidate division WWE3 bacterium GW2011_GWA1_41_8]
MGIGKLYIVAGSIGNLSDITFRAIEILKDVELILSEDTRETDKLLNHYSLKKSQISYRDQNHEKVYLHILDTLKSGRSVALVSDSGTPVISDPGFKLVRDLKAEGIDITPIPGPSAIIAAISASGLPTDKFIFLGFLPKTANQRKNILKEYGKLDATLTIYESPYRVRRLLIEIQDTLGDRAVCVAKDLTKIHESILTGQISDILTQSIPEKGEYTVLIAKEGFKWIRMS